MPLVDPLPLLLVALLGVVLVVLLITWVRIPAFIALAAGSFFVGLAARMPLADIPRAFQQGVGDTLGFIAMVVGLGTVIGKLLAESGGAVVVSRVLVSALGEKRLDWAMLLSGFLIGLPVFFQVGLVLLAPVLFTVMRQTGTPMLRLAIPLIAGLSVAHGFVPPHPGPLAAIAQLGADTGRTLFYSLVVGLPVALVAGPLFGRFISRRGSMSRPGAMADQLSGEVAAPRLPSLAITLLTILLPVLLMLLAALAQATLPTVPCANGSALPAARSSRCCSPRSWRSTRSGPPAGSTASVCCALPRSRFRPSPACSWWSAPAAGSAACSTQPASTRRSRNR